MKNGGEVFRVSSVFLVVLLCSMFVFVIIVIVGGCYVVSRYDEKRVRSLLRRGDGVRRCMRDE
jgi:hypothetical protein